MIFSACSCQIRGVFLPVTRYIGKYGERRDGKAFEAVGKQGFTINIERL